MSLEQTEYEEDLITGQEALEILKGEVIKFDIKLEDMEDRRTFIEYQPFFFSKKVSFGIAALLIMPSLYYASFGGLIIPLALGLILSHKAAYREGQKDGYIASKSWWEEYSKLREQYDCLEEHLRSPDKGRYKEILKRIYYDYIDYEGELKDLSNYIEAEFGC